MLAQGLGYTLLLLSVVSGSGVVPNRRVKRGWFSGGGGGGGGGGGPQAGVPCAFNPCSVAGFCGAGRTCNIDNTCRHECTCDAGSDHALCVTSESDVTSESVTTVTAVSGRRCTFNLCEMPTACDGGRECSLDPLCRMQCRCTSQSTHETCDVDADVTTSTETSKTGDDDAACVAGCEHGVCVRASGVAVCQCEEGWAGPGCDVPAGGPCTLHCRPGTVCTRLHNLQQVCQPRTQHTSPAGEIIEPHSVVTAGEIIISTTDTMVIIVETSTTVAQLNSSDHFNVSLCEEGYRGAARAYQVCSGGLRCQHGTCVDLDEGRDGQAGCECEPGAGGPWCDTRCCRECGENGRCHLAEDGRETCTCHGNFTGTNCSLALSQGAYTVQ